jgi:hypothetical protein
MSIQAECREAMNRLAARGVIFTEMDVADAASLPNWTQKQYVKAQRAAYAVLQGDYRKGRLVRYGPVEINGSKDYVRNKTKIVYAGMDKGPDHIETPNGIFHRMLAEGDEISAVGRRPGIARDDFTPWDANGNGQHRSESDDREPVSVGNGASTDFDVDELVDLIAMRVTADIKKSLVEALSK